MRGCAWLGVTGLVLPLVAGCAEMESADDFYMDDDVPAGSCMTETGPCDTETTGPATCQASTDCGAGETCMATFDGDIGEFECRSACVEDMDEASWCIDDTSCCSAGSVCSDRGYCRPGESTSASESESGIDTSTGDPTDASTGTTSGTGGAS